MRFVANRVRGRREAKKVVFCKPDSETEALVLEKQSERRRPTVTLPCSLAGVACDFPDNACWSWEMR